MKTCMFLLIATFFCGCSDDDQLSKIYSGTAQALKNGESWSTLVVFSEQNYSTEKAYSIHLDLIHPGGRYVLESLGIYNIQNIQGPQNVSQFDMHDLTKPLSATFSTLIGGDIAGHFYDVDTSRIQGDLEQISSFQITKTDRNKSEIEGTFDISFLIFRESNEDPNPPQKIHFTEGKFKVKVSQEWFD
jgi:hypothetical protein